MLNHPHVSTLTGSSLSLNDMSCLLVLLSEIITSNGLVSVHAGIGSATSAKQTLRNKFVFEDNSLRGSTRLVLQTYAATVSNSTLICSCNMVLMEIVWDTRVSQMQAELLLKVCQPALSSDTPSTLTYPLLHVNRYNTLATAKNLQHQPMWIVCTWL